MFSQISHPYKEILVLICLRDVPQSERHLLFCTDPRLDGRPRRRRQRAGRGSRVKHGAHAPVITPKCDLAFEHRIVVPLAAGFDAAGTGPGELA
ncbi:MAG: hypothetical protein D6744_08540 [Planctomycetota bacterium]|nr:MAG: hypothetical protein D6744_08540 [Planctomycetota bacterium]